MRERVHVSVLTYSLSGGARGFRAAGRVLGGLCKACSLRSHPSGSRRRRGSRYLKDKNIIYYYTTKPYVCSHKRKSKAFKCDNVYIKCTTYRRIKDKHRPITKQSIHGGCECRRWRGGGVTLTMKLYLRRGQPRAETARMYTEQCVKQYKHIHKWFFLCFAPV